MRIIVITSGTGAKTVQSPNPLAAEDFRRGAAHVASQLRDRAEQLVAAEDLYAGDQHRLLMEGVRRFRRAWPGDAPHSLQLHIVSPGYGLVAGDREVAPYDVSFQGMNPGELREWSELLAIPTAIRRVLRPSFDVGFLLLGRPYLAACALDDGIELGGCTFAFGGGAAARELPPVTNLRQVPVGLPEAAAFHCPLFRLKGKIVGGWLTRLAGDPWLLPALLAGNVDPVAGWADVA
jgi:hypothetical protein